MIQSMSTLKFTLGVETGRDGTNRFALYMATRTEVWIVFSDTMGVCFRKKLATGRLDYSPDDMKRQYLGIYRTLSQKWNELLAVVQKPPEA